MTRILAIVFVVMLVWWALERALRVFQHSSTGRQVSSLWRILAGLSNARQSPPGGSRQASGVTSRLLRCSVCQTHVREDRCFRVVEGVTPAVYCSEDCLRTESAAKGG